MHSGATSTSTAGYSGIEARMGVKKIWKLSVLIKSTSHTFPKKHNPNAKCESLLMLPHTQLRPEHRPTSCVSRGPLDTMVQKKSPVSGKCTETSTQQKRSKYLSHCVSRNVHRAAASGCIQHRVQHRECTISLLPGPNGELSLLRRRPKKSNAGRHWLDKKAHRSSG